MAVVADRTNASAAISSGHLMLGGTVFGLLSVAVAAGFAIRLPSSLSFDGPAADVPVIPDEAIASVQRPIIAGALVTAAVSLIAGIAAWGWLQRRMRYGLLLWLVAGFAGIANVAGALLLTSRPFLSGTDPVEVVRGAMPLWPLALATLLWLAQVLAYLAAAMRTGPRST